MDERVKWTREKPIVVSVPDTDVYIVKRKTGTQGMRIGRRSNLWTEPGAVVSGLVVGLLDENTAYVVDLRTEYNW